MHRLNSSFLLGYHGCPVSVADSLLSGGSFNISENDYDWLGPGIYFWQANPKRAEHFALEVRKRKGEDYDTAVVGAVIDPGLCLDLASDAGVAEVRQAHRALITAAQQSNSELPTNSGGSDLLLRRLDCAVIRMLHDIRAKKKLEKIDTVSGIFVEGDPIYENSGFFAKTHIQICVCSLKQIRGVFRVPPHELEA